MKYLNGSCLCGKIKIQVPDQFDPVGQCHCSECRKFSGSAFAALGGVAEKDLKILQGEDAICYYHKNENTDLAFCRVCGSSLFSKKLKAGRRNIRLGVLDDAPAQTPAFHAFVGSKASWHEITDRLPRFPERP